eukprot:1147894-Pelagomonas_calceolata.AAC.1
MLAFAAVTEAQVGCCMQVVGACKRLLEHARGKYCQGPRPEGIGAQERHKLSGAACQRGTSW